MSRYKSGDEVLLEYNGYYYMPEDDIEEDNVKRFHDVKVKGPDGGYHYCGKSFPCSPYSTPSLEQFKRWIDMGKPTREEMGGNTREAHEAHYQKYLDSILLGEL